MNKILKAYLKRLTNLSSRNKSLLLSSLPAEQFLDLHETDFLLSKSSFEVITQLIQRKSRIPLCDMQDPRYDRVNELSRKLRKIARTEQFIEEERGARDLYVGYPFVRGKFSDGSVVHAPLLFFPVTLRLDREQWCLFGRDDAEISLNRSFALAYAHFNEVKVPDEILEKSFEDFPRDPLEFRTALYEWLKETPFRINFNQKLFEDTLLPFDKVKSSDLQLLEKNGELKLYPELILGIFPQAGSYLVPDYHHLLREAEQGVLKMPLFLVENEQVVDAVEASEVNPEAEPLPQNTLKEEHILTPLPADVSQEQVIRLVRQGQSVVVQGPPGTGKSQLICNLMADFAAHGKRVLLVCQKRAALDVVHHRLHELGMAPFVALIHDFKNDRSGLFRQLAAHIEKVDEYRKENYSLDAVFLDREFTRESRLIDQVVHELELFRAALFDESECGISVKELYLSSDPTEPDCNLRPYYRSFPFSSLDGFRRNLRSYCTYAYRLGPEHSWLQRLSFANYHLPDLQRMETELRQFFPFFQEQIRQFGAWTSVAFHPDFIQNIPECTERIEDVLSDIADFETFTLFQNFLQDEPQAPARLAFARQVVQSIEGWIADGSAIEESLPANELPVFRAQLAKAIEANASAVSGTFWKWFGKEKATVTRVANANGLGTTPEELHQLNIRLKNRMELEQWLQNQLLRATRPAHTNTLSEYQGYLKKVERAADAVLRLRLKPWQSILTNISLENTDFGKFTNTFQEIYQWLLAWQQKREKQLSFLATPQWDSLLEEPLEFSEKLRHELTQDFDSLVEMDKITLQFSSVEQSVVALLMEHAAGETAQTENLLQLFENSLRLAWIEHIEAKHPLLRAVSSLKMEHWEEQLQAGIGRKQTLSRDTTLMQLREATYQGLENNRLGNRTTYRELYHQVTKKRKLWPIRKVLEGFSDEVFRLIPCWMASPEAVSTLFPMQSNLFDLVIFDEASQCYAEYGLPAVYRGRQLVVTGDSKQLPPGDLYKVRFEENQAEDENPVALEIDSLLDLAAQSLVQQQLTGHYRSSSLDLIDFSNRHFYKNTLRLLPDFHQINDAEPGIHYLHVEGVWEKNTNLAEARQIVTLLTELSGQALSVGVVTFNFHQQQLIQDILDQENVQAPELFVKNIENVQGDERDVIIFSLGYAPDPNGRLVMQFGSLNTQGGENRLNVAITRARRKVYVVTSLWPEQLQTDQTANEGPKLLKAYLSYAREVSEGRYRPQPAPMGNYRSKALLKDLISVRQPEYQPELPFADLTRQSADGRYEALLLTDDDLYYGSTSAKEPHAYLPLILKKKNWPFLRLYSREFWRNANKKDL
ncbi:AAA domain-containing protein [Arundinibacter roseus]|uniref:DUF4011 domain-containing protein n=1 Tax=Arundinibacter roseus TaxID=2070510 RepID=A0A4R4JVD6_9BACT|nr:AAA domain-containing protein [Arundinibacter roseus]TDB58658.1 DUF4011 domain-containing protein [Arundinibacter roseus]